jgi:hypothetical protein
VRALDDAAHLLDVWETCTSVSGVMRSVVLLHAAGAVADRDTALDLSVDEAARLAATLYTDTFGDVVDGALRCGGCTEVLDVALPLSALPAAAPGLRARVDSAVGVLDVRTPTVRDLLLAAGDGDPAAALLDRCVTRADGEPVDVSAFGADVLAQVDRATEEFAGLASLVVTTSCPACGGDLRASVDMSTLLWERICVAAPVLLAEVAELAAAFGWSERDVLALSTVRRRAYLDITRAGAA